MRRVEKYVGARLTTEEQYKNTLHYSIMDMKSKVENMRLAIPMEVYRTKYYKILFNLQKALEKAAEDIRLESIY